MLQANRVSFPIRKDVGVFGKESGDLFIYASDQFLIDGDTDQNGIDALRGGMNPVQRVPLINLVPAIFFLPGKILFNDEFAVLDDQDAMDVLVGAILDLCEQLLGQITVDPDAA